MYINLSLSKLPCRAEPEDSTFTIAMTLTSPFLDLEMTHLKFPHISRFLVFCNSEYDSKGKGELTWSTKEKGQWYKKRGRGLWQWHKLWMTHANNNDDELITQRDDSWSFQQDHCLSNTQIGIDTYYFSSFEAVQHELPPAPKAVGISKNIKAWVTIVLLKKLQPHITLMCHNIENVWMWFGAKCQNPHAFNFYNVKHLSAWKEGLSSTKYTVKTKRYS